jgi:hypothetical protein
MDQEEILLIRKSTLQTNVPGAPTDTMATETTILSPYVAQYSS